MINVIVKLLVYNILILNRGQSHVKKAPFRKWYGCLGELISLIPEKSNVMVLTATATKKSKHEILESLNLPADTSIIQQSPNRKNIKYIKQYLDKNCPLEQQFGFLLKELKEDQVKTPRTIIYCQTRKQCAIIFRLFEFYLGKNMYKAEEVPENRMVEMYHAGTADTVKKHILANMADAEGHIRVLVSTIAFGMGVNCKDSRRIVHFGPSKTVEAYVQECGRAGRDGGQSTCVLYYNGLLSTHCDADMKQYIYVDECMRKWLMGHFSCDTDLEFDCLHDCCSNCMNACDCGSSSCKEVWSPQMNDECEPPTMDHTVCPMEQGKLTRVVTQTNKQQLKRRLVKYQQDLIKEVSTETMVSCPNVLFEFNMFHINQVVDNCHNLFSLGDVLHAVEIWRNEYAIAILNIVKELFGETNMNIPSNLEMADVLEDSIPEWDEWNNVRDDSTLIDMLDSNDLRDFDTTMEDQDHNDTFTDVSMS